MERDVYVVIARGAQEFAVLEPMLANAASVGGLLAGVAGEARSHPYVLGLGLVLSIALMAFAASLITGFLGRCGGGTACRHSHQVA